MSWRDRLRGFRDWLNETDSNQPEWAIVLSTLYNADPPESSTDSRAIQRTYTVPGLLRATPVDSRTFYAAMDKLQSWDLIETETETLPVVADDSGESETMTTESVQLTNDGFSVAHDRQLGQNQNKLNHSLVLVTALLVLINFIAVAPLSNDETAIVVVVFGILFVILIARTDMLER